MIHEIPEDYYRLLLKEPQRFAMYSEIFFPELFRYLENDEHPYWFFFQEGKSIFIFNKDKEAFVNQSLAEIKEDGRFLNRNMVFIENNHSVLFFLESNHVNHYFDSKFSEKILVHKSDADFIDQHHISELSEDKILKKIWKEEFKHLLKAVHDPKLIRFYIVNSKDKVVLSQPAAAETIDSLGIDFYIGQKNRIVVPQKTKTMNRMKALLAQRNLHSFNSNMLFYIFAQK